MIQYRSFRFLVFSMILLFFLNFISTTTVIYYEEVLNIIMTNINMKTKYDAVVVENDKTMIIGGTNRTTNLPQEDVGVDNYQQESIQSYYTFTRQNDSNHSMEQQEYIDSYNFDKNINVEVYEKENQILSMGTATKEEYITTNDSKEIVTNVVAIPTTHSSQLYDFNIVYEGTKGLMEFSKQYWDLRLCDAISDMLEMHNNHSNGNNTLINYMYTIITNKKQNSFTNLFQYTKDKTILYNLSFSSNDLYYAKGSVGTGNYIMAFYSIRLIAKMFGNIKVIISCDDADIMKETLLLPWLTGSFPLTAMPSENTVSSTSTTNEEDLRHLTHTDVCRRYSQAYMVHDMQYELRRMAISLVGIPYKGHPAEQWAYEYFWSNSSNINSISNKRMNIPDPSYESKPIYSNNIILDDVIFHFRCGDIVQRGHKTFGFMKYESYLKFIMGMKFNSIGIVTQPFSNDTQQREVDRHGNEKCKKLLFAFINYLDDILNRDYKMNNNIHASTTTNTTTSINQNMMQMENNTISKSPYINIRILNDASETIALTYARIIMAKYNVVGTTSFGTIASLASFGKSYILETNYKGGPNKWLSSSDQNINITDLVNHVQMINEPLLSSLYVKDHWGDNGDHILDWLQNYSKQEEK